MTDPPTEPSEKPARSLNRWSIGTLSLLQLVLFFLSLLALNYLSANHYRRADFSRDGVYTLSQATRNYLKDPKLTSRERPIKWIMAYRRSSPFYERVRALAEDYAQRSDGKITLELLDPMRSPDRTAEVMKSYGLSMTRDMIIMDARTDDSPPITEDATGVKTLNPHVKLVAADDMTLFTKDDKGQRRPTGFQGEDMMTARLVESLEGRPRKMVLLADKSRLDADSENSPWKSLEQTLRFQNIELTAINLSGLEKIPDDAEGVALVAPKYDFTDAEISVLENYWNTPKSAVLMLLKPGDVPQKLRAFLRGNGVTPRKDRIIEKREGRTISSQTRGIFTYGVNFTKDLAGQATVFEGASSSLEVRENAENLLNKKVTPLGLIQVAEGFWGETHFGDGKETFDPQSDTAPPLFIAAGVTRGAQTDDRYAADVSHMLVISNTDFLDPDHQRAENIDFLASGVNWLVGRQSLVGIGPRSLGTYKMPLLDAQVSFINRVNLFFIPAALLLIGAFVWSSRRA
ncbi:MAG: Gldg family protein [Luteolibacter sp.]